MPGETASSRWPADPPAGGFHVAHVTYSPWWPTVTASQEGGSQSHVKTSSGPWELVTCAILVPADTEARGPAGGRLSPRPACRPPHGHAGTAAHGHVREVLRALDACTGRDLALLILGLARIPRGALMPYTVSAVYTSKCSAISSF